MKADAALRVHVECEPGHLGEKPKRFRLNSRDVEIVENLDQWLGPDYRYFKVRGDDGNLYILRHDEGRDAWELTMFQSPQAEAFASQLFAARRRRADG